MIQDESVAGFFYERKKKRADVSKELKQTNINDLHTKLEYPFEDITWTTVKVMSIQLTGIINSCKACVLGKAKKTGVSMIPVPCSQLRERGCSLLSALHPMPAWVVRNTDFL